ncbi:MAG TPA: archease [Balneolales bacterium]|nr:archease [Balneolales bacterium]
MQNIRFQSHIADIRMKIESDSLPELFLAGLSGMNQLLKKYPEQNNGESAILRTINIKSVDTTTMLIDFLSEVLTLSHIDQAVFTEVDFNHLSDHEISAIIKGIKLDHFDEDVKAVTYHEANIKQNQKGKWSTIVIFDI